MKKYLLFYIPYFLLVVGVVILILCNDKANLHLWLTSFHNPISDVFFHYYTYVGDWIPYTVVTGLLFFKYRAAIFVLVSLFAAGLVSIIFKHIWDEPRPLKFFADNFPQTHLHLVAGVHVHLMESFPSGHTISAFAFFLALCFFTKRPFLHFLFLILAVLVGYSRIYLSQHFVLDVLIGSLIGVIVTAFCQVYFEKKTMIWADGSLRDVFSIKKRR